MKKQYVWKVFDMRARRYLRKTWTREQDVKAAISHGSLRYIKMVDPLYFEVVKMDLTEVERMPLLAYIKKEE